MIIKILHFYILSTMMRESAFINILTRLSYTNYTAIILTNIFGISLKYISQSCDCRQKRQNLIPPKTGRLQLINPVFGTDTVHK